MSQKPVGGIAALGASFLKNLQKEEQKFQEEENKKLQKEAEAQAELERLRNIKTTFVDCTNDTRSEEQKLRDKIAQLRRDADRIRDLHNEGKYYGGITSEAALLETALFYEEKLEAVRNMTVADNDTDDGHVSDEIQTAA